MEFSLLATFNKVLVVLSSLVVLDSNELPSIRSASLPKDRPAVTATSREALLTIGDRLPVKHIHTVACPFLGGSIGTVSAVHLEACLAEGSAADVCTARSAPGAVHYGNGITSLVQALALVTGLYDGQLLYTDGERYTGMHTAAEEKGAELKAIAAAKTTDRREKVILVVYK